MNLFTLGEAGAAVFSAADFAPIVTQVTSTIMAAIPAGLGVMGLMIAVRAGIKAFKSVAR